MQRATLSQREDALYKAVDESYKKIELLKGVGQTPWGIFVAPEYLFAYPSKGDNHAYGDQRHLNENDKTNLLKRLEEKSKNCPGLVIIPGTVAWEKTLWRPDDRANHKKGANANKPKSISRAEKAITAVADYAKNFKSGNLNAPLSGPHQNHQATTTKNKLDLLELQMFDPYAWIRIARNTAYILYEGKTLLKYNKKADFHEVLTGNNVVHIPGKHPGRFELPLGDLSLRPISCGIEICLDHAFDTLEKSIPPNGAVDIHILVSAWIQPKPCVGTVKPGGYMVHASSNDRVSKVYKHDLGSILWGHREVSPDEKIDLGKFPINIYKINLNLSPPVNSSQILQDELDKFLNS